MNRCFWVVLLLAAFVIPFESAEGGTLYSGGFFGSFYSIDPATGGRTDFLHPPFGLPNFPAINGLAYNTRNQHFYATSIAPTSPPGSTLGRTLFRFSLDSDALASGPISGLTLAAGQSIEGLEYDRKRDVLWGAIPTRHELIRIDPYTFQATVAGQLPVSSLIGGLAYDQATDVLYGVDDAAGGTGQPQLVAINLDTFQLNGIGPIRLGLGLNDVDSLAFDPRSRSLYAINDAGDSFDTRQLLVRIDPSTGLASAVGPPDVGIEVYQGLAFIVPEPNSVTLAGTMICVIVFKRRVRGYESRRQAP